MIVIALIINSAPTPSSPQLSEFCNRNSSRIVRIRACFKSSYYSFVRFIRSSDDGTCRIWDARHAQLSPRIYVPKPADALAGKSSDPSSSVGQQNHQILCCAYNANGTVFVTGSSDTYARVWNACKSNPEDSEQPNHVMDLLSGHENDVNYAQFSGCPVASRTSTADSFKEDNVPKFKNSWFTHDNIVTCSRDGSAIIWIPKSHRSHGKVGRWTRAYHLKVPPPPMPPQPARGGPRQRFQPTPRGVNMIVWSLDNRFVLAAIMEQLDSRFAYAHTLCGHETLKHLEQVKDFTPCESSVYALMGKIHKRLNMHAKDMFYFGIALDLKPPAADVAAIKSAMEKLHLPDELEDNL